MSDEPDIPIGITHEELWREHCREIRARASDLLEGRLGVIETARALLPLAAWTKVDREPEFQLFSAIASESDALPIGAVRAYWSPEALVREDVRIREIESFWDDKARSAATVLIKRYGWTVLRKQSFRREG